ESARRCLGLFLDTIAEPIRHFAATEFPNRVGQAAFRILVFQRRDRTAGRECRTETRLSPWPPECSPGRRWRVGRALHPFLGLICVWSRRTGERDRESFRTARPRGRGCLLGLRFS